MNSKIWHRILPAIAWTAGLCYAIFTPGDSVPSLPKLPGFDKIVHFGLFCGLVFLWSRVWGASNQKIIRKLFINYLVFGIVFAIFTEYLQTYVPNRGFDHLDIAANIAGGTFGIILYVYLKKKGSILV